MGLLKRNAADRFDFDSFFNHPFIRPVMSEVSNVQARTSPVKVPYSDRESRQTPPTATATQSVVPSADRNYGAAKNYTLPLASDNTNNPGTVENQPLSSKTQIVATKSVTAKKTSPNTSKTITTSPRGQQAGLSQSPNSNKQYPNG